MLLQGRAIGLALLMCGIAIIAGFRARRVQLFFEAESRSTSLPARMLCAHLLILLLSALPAIVYLEEFPLYMMDPGSQRVFIYAGVTAVLAAGALIASLIALRLDRADRSLQ